MTDWRQRPPSEVGRRLGGLLPSLASDGPAPFLPNGEAITGADLLGVLEEASGACDDATGQPLSRVPCDLGQRMPAPAQVIFSLINDQASANHIPHLQLLILNPEDSSATLIGTDIPQVSAVLQ